jgi:hypothetical protein
MSYHSIAEGKTMPSTNIRERSSQLLVLGLVAGLLVLVAFAQRADAQRVPPRPIRIPFAPPDLVVVVNVPAQIQQSGQALVEIRVDNTLTPVSPTPSRIMGGSAVNGVSVVVRFAGLEPLTVQGNSGFQCGLAGSGGTAPPTQVTCTGGAIPAGGTATISVSVKERGNCKIYCGPVYTDALVEPGNAIAERSKANNRDLGVTDVIDCVN